MFEVLAGPVSERPVPVIHKEHIRRIVVIGHINILPAVPVDIHNVQPQ